MDHNLGADCAIADGRELVRETESTSSNSCNLFCGRRVRERESCRAYGTYRNTPDSLKRQIHADLERGVRKFLLFGVPAQKAEAGFSYDFTARQIADLKREFGKSLWLAVDVCLCSATSHGQCGILSAEGDHVRNAATVRELAKAATAYAQAGADCVAPSDMMDGRIAAIRQSLTAAGLNRTLLMSYSAKFHSKFYGPFRAAADSAPRQGIARRDYRSIRQLSRRVCDSRRDLMEGADILMVKPGMPYLDVLSRLSRKIARPWAVYEVSGEFAAIEILGEKGLMNGPLAHVEAWTSFVRAGASIIITYGARFGREWLKQAEGAF